MGIPMDTKADCGLNHTPVEVSFVRGGPFYRAQQALGLIHPNKTSAKPTFWTLRTSNTWTALLLPW